MQLRKIIYQVCFLSVILLSYSISTKAQVIKTEKPAPPKHLSANKLLHHYIFPYQNYNSDALSNSSNNKKFSFYGLSRKPGVPLLSSTLVPGLGQAENHQWILAGIFAGIETTALILHFHYYHEAQVLRKDYRNFADHNWSLVKYARFLVNYHNAFFPNNPISYNSLAKPGYQLGTSSPDTRSDWNRVNLYALRQLEKRTYYGGTTGDAFSHSLPDLGSQQYYELMSKYYQFAPGWKDFNTPPKAINWSPAGMPADWHLGAKKAFSFNNHYRIADKMLMITIFNHVVSAFDAYFAAKLHDEHLHASSYYISKQNNGFMLRYSF